MEKSTKLFINLSNRINNKYLKILNDFDKQISKNLLEGNIEMRPVNSNGLWCCCVLPILLMTNQFLYPVSPIYRLVAFISLGLLFYSILFILFLSMSCLVLRDSTYGGCVASSLVSALLLFAFLNKGLIYSLLFSIPTLYSYSILLRVFLTKFPKTFTVGEGMIVVQAIVLYAVMTVANLFHEQKESMRLISAVVNTALSTVGVIVTALYMMRDTQRNPKGLARVIIGAAIFALIMIHCILGVNSILTIISYVFMNAIRIKLFSFWLFLVLMSVCVLLVRTQLAVKATTVTRKLFHILASTVFLTGIVYDKDLMLLASGVGLVLLILTEALRKSRIEPISSGLQSAFELYSDEKDSGTFAMTAFYLFCGLASPLLIVPDGASQLELLSGVLSIGVGDTAASWFGSRYGFNKWADTSKSVEGTTFNILSQIATVYLLLLFELIDARNGLVRATVAAIVSGLAEAMTEQVDNLILPLVMMIAFQVTSPLSYAF